MRVSVGGSFLQLNQRASFEVYVETFPSPALGKRQISSGGRPVWSRDGKELTTLCPDGKGMAVDAKTSGFRFEAGTDIPVIDSRTSAFGFMFYDVSKDGDLLIPAKTGQAGLRG